MHTDYSKAEAGFPRQLPGVWLSARLSAFRGSCDEETRPCRAAKAERLHPEILAGIGAVAVYSQTVEFRVEWAIWDLTAEEVAGRRPSTDSKPISALIERLKEIGTGWSDDNLQAMIGLWCETASLAFTCRNSILHGLPLAFGGLGLVFRKSMALKGELRNRAPAEFHADGSTLELLQNVFSELLTAIVGIAAVGRSDMDFHAAFAQPRIDALRSARSIAVEIEYLAAAVNSEKY
jgi:hypothetical protein